MQKRFYPSIIEDQIYNLMDKDENFVGFDFYAKNLYTEVIQLFETQYPNIEYTIELNDWQDMNGQTAFLAWIENGHLHSLTWDQEGVFR